MLNNEVWKDIGGYEGIYQVSSLGNVRSLNRVDIISDERKFNRKGIMLKFKLCRKGYHRVQLYKNHKGKHCNVHRLVAIEFIPNLNNLAQVNHINGDKSDNSVNNLEWITNEDNMKHGIENNLMNFGHRATKVNQFSMDGEFIKSYPSMSQAHRDTGISNGGISMCAKGEYTHSGGFIWRYAND